MTTSDNERLRQFEIKRLEQQKYNRRIYRRLFTGLIIGIILFLIPFIFDTYNKLRTEPLVRAYQKNTPKPDPSLAPARAYNRQIVKFQQRKVKQPDITKVQKDLRSPIGYVTIPAINLKNMMMRFGESDWVLEHGVGVLDWTSLPIGGKSTHSVITGHTGLANQVYFDNIRYLKKGDVIYLHTFGKKLAYEVVGRKIIDPSDKRQYSVLNVTKGRDRITLLTCTPIFVNSHRLLIFAKRVPLKTAARTKTTRRDIWSLEHVWMLVVFLLILLLLIWFVYQRHAYNKQVQAIEEQLRGLNDKDIQDENH
ncbi:class C sortase [Lapidilactobacillus bayanensis]|uniref:class C sortase n=1 Tax=Lapidilactobacillus bayanensis TaxID=2485998 RepID=UPI000F782813|nr:class C sortase [Lapidilactobacillus bayanensis]